MYATNSFRHISTKADLFYDSRIEKLRHCSGSYSLTATKRNICANCKSDRCSACPIKAEYDRLFDILCDREERREEQYQKSLSVLLGKYGNKKAATC